MSDRADPPPPDGEGLSYPSPFRANLTLALLFVAYIFSFLDRQILSLMVDPVRRSLDITDFQMSLLQGFAFSIFFVIAGVVIGRLADRYRRTWIIAGGILLWSLMTAASGFAGSFMVLFIARIGLGVGEAALAPAGFSLLSDSFRPSRQVWATSIFSLGSLVGGGLAFFVGGALIEYLSQTPRPFQILDLEPWQMAFICASLPGLLLVPALFMLPEPDRLGSVSGTSQSLRQTVRYLWSRKNEYAPFFACAVLLGIPNYGGLAWFPTHMIRAFNMGPLEAGSTLGAMLLAGSILGALSGAALTDFLRRRGYRNPHLRTIATMSVGIAIGLGASFMSTVGATLALWAIALFCMSAYFGIVMAALQTMTPNEMRASTTAILIMVMSLCGMGLGVALIGAVSDIFFADVPAGIGRSLAIVAIPAALLSAAVAIRGMRGASSTHTSGPADAFSPAGENR